MKTITEPKPLIPVCTHPGLPVVKFDPVAAKDMTETEIRERFPRHSGYCPVCSAHLVRYASDAHYLAGGW